MYEDLRQRRDLSMASKVIITWLAPLVERGFHPGTRVIAEKCGCSRGAAMRALEQLRDAGLLSWTQGRSGAGRRYRVTLPPGPESGPVTGIETGPVTERDRPQNETGPESGPVTGTKTGPGVVPNQYRSPVPKRDHIKTKRPIQDQETPPNPPGGGAVRVSSLSGLPDPLGELEAISSEEFVTRAFDAVGRKIGMAPPPRRPQDRARAQELERWALELAPRVAESRGMDVAEAFTELVRRAFTQHAEAYREAEEARRAGKPARAVEWRLGWVASRWERYTQRAVAS